VLNLIFDSVIETSRLILRCKNFDDAEHLFRLRSDNEYFELFGREPYTKIEQAVEFIQRLNEDEFSYTFSILPKNKDEAIGSVCLWNIEFDNKIAEIGYSLEKEYRGFGYAFEACEAVVRYAFDKLKMQTVTAFPNITNQPSVILLEKLGFKCVGTKKMTAESGEESEHYDFRIV
jgi:ribosomal-protein-alanine N-acetyltransferase